LAYSFIEPLALPVTGALLDGASLGVLDGTPDVVPAGVEGAVVAEGRGVLSLGLGANADPQFSGSAQPENSSAPAAAPTTSAWENGLTGSMVVRPPKPGRATRPRLAKVQLILMP
jgi:hypothetical protein